MLNSVFINFTFTFIISLEISTAILRLKGSRRFPFNIINSGTCENKQSLLIDSDN